MTRLGAAMRGGTAASRSAILAVTLSLASAAWGGGVESDQSLSNADRALMRGDAATAVASLDHAASHSAEAEALLVRAKLLLGRYRQALDLAGHSAGEHRESPGASALYAWLLSMGGQRTYALRMLKDLQSNGLADDVVAKTIDLLQSPSKAPGAALLSGPYRMVPDDIRDAERAAPSPHGHVISNAVLLGDGQHALVPWSVALAESNALRIRNGLGQSTTARLDRRLDDGPLALVSLDTPLEPVPILAASLAPFAGSPGWVVTFACAAPAQPAWPWMFAGFLGRQADDGTRQVSSAGAPADCTGAPVFDSAGRLLGVMAIDRRGASSMVPIGTLREDLGFHGPEATQSPDLIYERSLRSVLQVIADGPKRVR